MSQPIVVIMAHPKKGQTADDCRRIAEGGGGASAYDEFGQACWKVYGKEIKILEDENSIMEGFIITNLNFNVQSSQGAVPNQSGLPGSFSNSNANGTQQLSPYGNQGSSGGINGPSYGFGA
jgi:hypothetical protein